MDMKKSLELK